MRHLTAFLIGVGLLTTAALAADSPRNGKNPTTGPSKTPAAPADKDAPPREAPKDPPAKAPADKPADKPDPNKPDPNKPKPDTEKKPDTTKKPVVPQRPRDDTPNRDDADRARTLVAEAEARVTRAELRVRSLEDEVRDALITRDRAAADLSTANQAEGELTRTLGTMEQSAREAVATRDRQTKSLEPLLTRVNDAKRNTSGAEAELQTAARQAEERFNKDPSTLARQEAVEAATRRLASEQQRVRDKLATDPSFKQLKATADANDALVKQARAGAPADTEVLTRASQAWIDSKSAVDAAERKAFAADAEVVGAEKTLAAAKQTQIDALAAFKAQLPNDPAYAPVATALESRRAEQASAEKEYAAAAAEARGIQEKAAATIKDFDTVSARLRETRASRDRLASQQLNADRAARLARDDLDAARDELRAARAALADARRRQG